MKKETWMPLFFAVAACSWVPHWACHYYRLETGSTFVVGTLNYSVLNSVTAILIYSILIALNIFSVSFHNIRFVSAFFFRHFAFNARFCSYQQDIKPFSI